MLKNSGALEVSGIGLCACGGRVKKEGWYKAKIMRWINRVGHSNKNKILLDIAGKSLWKTKKGTSIIH